MDKINQIPYLGNLNQVLVKFIVNYYCKIKM